MALSRIWAAFIILATLAATFQFIFSPGKQDIFNKMVVGKSGDTSKTITLDKAQLPRPIALALDTMKFIKSGDLKFVQSDTNKIISYQEQSADGIIATCKTSVDISLNLIGILALFLGFMSIAERAGGIRLLAKITSPFFSKLFPIFPKTILLWVTWS